MINTGNCRSGVGEKTGKSRTSTKWQKHMASLNNRYALHRKEALAQAAQLRAQINGFVFNDRCVEHTQHTAEEQKGLLRVLIMLLNRLGYSLAGLVQAGAALFGSGTALSGEESFPGGRLPSGTFVPAENRDYSRPKKVGGYRGLILTGILAAVAGLGAMNAKADPIMSINDNYSVGNYDGDTLNVGEEIKFTYLVQNISQNNIDDNNLIQLKLPGGSSQGVFYAKDENSNWQSEIQDDYTIFSGNGQFIDVNQSHEFNLYSSRTDGTLTREATAVAAGDASGNQYFNPVDVVSPIPEPMSVGLLGIGATLIGGYRRFTGFYKR